jgi:hypothetical protein
MKPLLFSYLIVVLGLCSGCDSEYHTPRTVIIDQVEDPLMELETVVGREIVDQMRHNQASIGQKTSYKHCIRNISTEQYSKLQKAMIDKKTHMGITHMVAVETCPLHATAQCVKIASADYYYSISNQLLESLKQKCEVDGTWFAFTNKHLANTSVSYSAYAFPHGDQN